MVKWTDQERKLISGIFSGIDYNDIGPKALCRCLIVYPWTQRYFSSYGDLKDATAIQANKNIAAHGVRVLQGLNLALKNMDNIKDAYSELSTLHSEKLRVDPDNFRLLSDCLTIVIAGKMGKSFTPEAHTALQKFMATVVSALGRQYY